MLESVVMDYKDNHLRVNLNIEQQERYTEILSLYPADDSLRFYNFLFFLMPEQILSYYCGKCNKDYQGYPKINVVIRDIKIRGDEDRDAHIGYLCNTCGTGVMAYPLRNAELVKIPEEFITFDATGDYKRPTPKSIDDLFREIESEALTGEGGGLKYPDYSKDIEIMLHWAEKIQFPINKGRLRRLDETYARNYLIRFRENLPNLLGKILDKGIGFSLHYDDGDECTPYEGFGLMDEVPSLLEALPNLTVEDPLLRKRILRILNLYESMYVDHADDLIFKKEELLKDLNKRISNTRRGLRESKRIKLNFLSKHNQTEEEINKWKEPMDVSIDEGDIPF